MAKANKVNKSQMIRDYLAEHPGAGPSEAAKALGEFGVSPAFVSFLKSRSKSESRSQPSGRRKKRPQRVETRTPSHSRKRLGGKRQDNDAVLLAVQLIRVCGGVEEAHAVLQAAERLRLRLQ